MEGTLFKVLLTIVAWYIVLISAETYYVTPSSNTPCSEEGVPCFTLPQYANKSSNYFASNTTLIFLPGNHSLDLELSFQNITVLSFEFNTTSQSGTSITCYESARFTFESISIVSMRGLALLGCVNNKVTKVGVFTVEDCSFHGQGRNGTGLYLDEVSIANITTSCFSSNTGTEIFEPLSNIKHGTQAGGAIICFNITLAFTISDCIFQNNTVTGRVGDYAYGGAVYVYSTLNIIILNTTLNNNTVIGANGHRAGGGAMHIKSSSNVTIVNSTLNNNTLSENYSYSVNFIKDIEANGAALSVSSSSNIAIVNSFLDGNTLTGTSTSNGGAFSALDCSNVTIVNSTLNNNIVSGIYLKTGNGGALYARRSSHITVVNSTLIGNAINVPFHNPYAESIDSTAAGGAVYTSDTTSVTIIVHSTLSNNSVIGYDANGGVVYVNSNTTNIVNSIFNGNTVTGKGDALGAGGAIYITSVGGSINYISIHMISSTFTKNKVIGDGGAVFAYKGDNGTIKLDVFSSNSTFSDNSCTGSGSVFYFVKATFNSSKFLNIQNNIADTSTALYAIQSTLYFSGNTTVMNNFGSLFVYSSNVTFTGYTNIAMNNLNQTFNVSEEGGAITAFQSDIVFDGRMNLMTNKAIRGGAIAATRSKIYVYGNVTISNNTAVTSGGGIYAYQSELNFNNHINISRNNATFKGGGIHAIRSTVRLTTGSKTNIVSNYAKEGGGIYLEGSTKIYILKTELELNCFLKTALRFDTSTADYGGAVYVYDKTSATCSASLSSNNPITTDECFIQGIDLYRSVLYHNEIKSLAVLNTYFTNNSARLAGDVLYGGLLDRCRASPFAEVFHKYDSLSPSTLSGISYLLNITDLEAHDFNSTKTISSKPVRVCFCKNNQPDCSYDPQPEYVRKGETFTVSLVAVDHINNSIGYSVIHASVTKDGKLGEGHSRQRTHKDGSCTDLTYSIFSQYKSLELHLYAFGPCMNYGISTASFTVVIEPCPIGFQDNSLHEHCDCSTKLYPEYISNCSIDEETVQRKDNAWFSYVNTTTHQGSYVLHKYCPFDYCKPQNENISVDLNIENGDNELCAFNRSRKLCGSCKDGLSLSLGSSLCRPCSNNWLGLLFVFALAGVILVAFILMLNFTVAEGTLNGLIFYANIFVENRTVFFPHDQTKVFTVFIAWLNLDFGFETCFFDGMDSYAKTWLQFAFPLYVISLVVAIIIISEKSTKFARLVTAGKNPIATLATLILLSYTKLLRAIIASLSVTTLQYSDGSSELVWLADANIPYLSPKHIPLFITALVIAIVSAAFTFILFAWQWIVYCADQIKHCFKEWRHCHQRNTLLEQSREEKETCLKYLSCINIVQNPKFIALIDAYHNPYNKDYRYWIGLLLIVRVVLYLISAVNVGGDPRINLLSIIAAIVIINSLKQIVESKREVLSRIHKYQLVEVLEVILLLNLALLTSVTFITENKDSQNSVAYVSSSIAFIIFLFLFAYHCYKFILKELFYKISSKFNSRRRERIPLPVNNTVSTNIEVSQAASEFEVNASPEDLLTKTLVGDDKRLNTDALGRDPSVTNSLPQIKGNPSYYTPAANCYKPSSNETEMPNLASERRCSLLSPSVPVETSSQEDGSSQSEDEYTPLITQQ